MQVVVAEQQDGLRLDKIVMAATQLSRRQARLCIATGGVRLRGRVLRILTRPMPAGAVLDIDAAAEAVAAAPPAATLPATPRIVYIDRQLVALDKPAGLLSEADRFGSPSLQSLVPALLQAEGHRGPLWLVHRLDAGTSGILVMARSRSAAAQLSACFRAGTAAKTYLALCTGQLPRPRGIDAPIARAQRTRHMVAEGGKPASTWVAPHGSSAHGTLVEARPKTGRTHQIRVHLQHVGHAILGDGLYSAPRYLQLAGGAAAVPRCMLHAAALQLPHPKFGTPLRLQAEVPQDFAALAQAMGLGAALTAWQTAHNAARLAGVSHAG